MSLPELWNQGHHTPPFDVEQINGGRMERAAQKKFTPLEALFLMGSRETDERSIDFGGLTPFLGVGAYLKNASTINAVIASVTPTY